MIVIGGSAGAFKVMRALLAELPGDFKAAILVALHVAPDGPGLLAKLLQSVSTLPVAHAIDGQQIRQGHVYVAPPDRHLVVDGDNLRVTRGPKENLSRPAVDPLFRSAAHAYGPRVIGVILTGRLDDGSAGLWMVKKRGGTAVVQAPEDASQPSMPRSALKYVDVDYQVTAAQMAPLLVELSRHPVRPERGNFVSKELEVETQIAKGQNALELGVMDLGPITPYTCPECHGVLVQLKEGGIPRFRCHTGHAYSLNSLLSEVTSRVENSLWGAVRIMEESLMVMQHVARHVREQGDVAGADLFEAKAKAAGERSKRVREALMAHETMSIDQVSEDAEE